jgi:hypothetical protein
VSTNEKHLALIALDLVDHDNGGLDDGAARQLRQNLEVITLSS